MTDTYFCSMEEGSKKQRAVSAPLHQHNVRYFVRMLRSDDSCSTSQHTDFNALPYRMLLSWLFGTLLYKSTIAPVSMSAPSSDWRLRQKVISTSSRARLRSKSSVPNASHPWATSKAGRSSSFGRQPGAVACKRRPSHCHPQGA